MFSKVQLASSVAGLVLVVALSACGGPSAPAKPTVELPEAKPLTVEATFDSSRAQVTLVALTGGIVTASGADGTTYTLTIPDGALLEETEVTMTPLEGITGAPVEGRAHGVLLEPSGLRLYQPATLEIAPADAEAFSAIGFAADADGSDFHLVPPLLAGGSSTVEFEVFHFSGHGAFTGSKVDPIIIIDSPAEFMPVDWEAQLAQMMAELLKAEREALLLGEEGDPDFVNKLEAILNTFYVEVIAPILPQIASDCSYAEANNAKVLSWVRSTVLWGLESTFSQEGASVWDAVMAGAHNCWEEAVQPCVDPNSPSFARVTQIARMNLLLGGSEDVYDPMREDIRCDEGSCAWIEDVEALSLELNFAWNESGSDERGSGTVDRSWQSQAVLPQFQKYGTIVGFIVDTVSGDEPSAQFDVDDVYTGVGDPSSTSGSGVPHRISLRVTFDTSDCTYDASFHIEADVVTVAGDISNEHSLTVGSVDLFDQSASQGGMTGSMALPHARDAADRESSFRTGWDDAAHLLIKAGLGTADVSWTIGLAAAP